MLIKMFAATLLFLSLVHSIKAAAMPCPRSCFCSSQTKIIYCAKMGLNAIPDAISSDALELNLNGNPFQVAVLQKSNFTGLRNLEKLYMSECGIEWIQMEAFRELVHLKWLDLSGNRIREIQDSTFRGLNLQQLFLNGNRHIRLGADSFAGLSATGIYLQDASLTHLSPDVFFPLNGSLRYLWLDGNALERLNSQFLPTFSQLRHLRLGSNPLHCGCDMSWLKDFYDSRADIFQGATAPSCSFPLRLRGRPFSEILAQELRCHAPVFSNIDTHFDSQRGRLRCSASGDPAPTLYWVRPTGEAKRYAPPLNADAKFNEAILITENIHHLASATSSGMYICIAANDVGNVTLTVNVTWPRALSSGSSLSDVFQNPQSEGSDEVIDDQQSGGDHRQQGPFIPSRLRPTTTVSSPSSSSSSSSSHQRSSIRPFVSSSSSPAQSAGNSYGAATKAPAEDDYRDAEIVFEDDKEADMLTELTIEDRFTVWQLVCAVLGTHVATLAICLLLLLLYEKRQSRRRHQNLWSTPEKHSGNKTAQSSPAPYLGTVGVSKPPSYLTYADYTR